MYPNISPISVTFFVLNLDTSMDVNDSQCENISCIFITFEVSIFPKFIFFNFLQSLNI